MARLRVLAVAALVSGLPFAAPASAQTVSETLSSARVVLGAFDVQAPETTNVIAALGQVGSQEGDPVTRRHARFVRAVAAADLVVISRLRSDRDLFERAATAYGETPDTLVAALDQDLARLRRWYPETVADARGALGRSVRHALPSEDREHVRSQAAFFGFAMSRLAWADAVSALAPLVADPCAAGLNVCPSPYRHFGTQGRRAVAAVIALFEVAAFLRSRAESGDPFSAALVREGLTSTAPLQSLELSPADWAPTVGAVSGPARGAAVRADAMVVVSADRVRVGWAPTVRFSSQGTAVVSAAGPFLADANEAFGMDPHPAAYVRPIDGLGPHLATHLANAERIAIAVEPGVEAHMLSRVLRSAEQGRVAIHALTTVGTDAVPRGVDFRAVREEDPNDRDSLGVFVRMGGFSVRRPHASHITLPRIRRADAWRFDLRALDQVADRAGRGHVRLRYMSTAPAELVLRAALAVAPSDAPLALVVP